MMKLVVANDQVRDNLFVEISHDGQAWAEVIFDDDAGKYVLTVFGGAEDRWPALDLTEALTMLEAARRELVIRGYPDVS